MSGADQSREHTLNDTEATLRQVDEVLNDFEEKGSRGRVAEVLATIGDRPAGLKDLVGILEAAYGEVVNIIESLRKSRGLLEKAAISVAEETSASLAWVD